MLIYIAVLTIAIAFLSSLQAWRLDIRSARVISIIMGFDCLTEGLALPMSFKFIHNFPVYNVNMLIEAVLYAWYYRIIIEKKTVRRLIDGYIVFLLLAWIILVFFVYGFDNWNSSFAVLCATGTVILSAYYYCELFVSEKLVHLSRSFEFWIATGLIIYFAGNFTFLGMLHFLTKSLLALAHALLVGLQILNILYYSIVIYAFRCLTPIKRYSLY